MLVYDEELGVSIVCDVCVAPVAELMYAAARRLRLKSSTRMRLSLMNGSRSRLVRLPVCAYYYYYYYYNFDNPNSLQRRHLNLSR